MNYTLNQLRIFQKIAETQSVTKAAEQLHLTQPAVSIQLKHLQAQFDIPLTEVVGRKIHITDFGWEIARAAESILDQAMLINQKTHAFKGRLTGRLKISTVSTGKYVMPYFLSSFMKQHDGVELLMEVTNKTRVIESLQANTVDFSLVSILPKAMQLEKIELLKNKLFLVANGDHKLKKGPYTKQIFKELPLIFREEGSGVRQAMETFIERNNVPVIKKMELTTNEAVKQAVLAGLGYSIMPLIGIKNELQNGDLSIIPVSGLPIKTQWQLIWPKGKGHSPVAQAFLQHLRKEKDQIIREQFAWYEDY
ncbi:MAG TPA: LysR family transcriptional regulator [Cyclobacteriaceae bacterium]|jgi:DNA-binding transcriptional LysR family regulator|nr:LysR family transcriptional regulator [Cytophagales bacterium]HNP76334.1 LysR family transcriptional regulator [Cyclobacteriaceae bacterium]